MMTPDQVKNITDVFRKFMDSETSNTWTDLDDVVSYLEFLDDEQLHREADVIYANHSAGNVGCGQVHKNGTCYMTKVVEAVGAILELYRETGQLHKNNRYILEYYLGMNQIGMIVLD